MIELQANGKFETVSVSFLLHLLFSDGWCRCELWRKSGRFFPFNGISGVGDQDWNSRSDQSIQQPVYFHALSNFRVF